MATSGGKAFQAGRIAPCKGPGAGVCLYVCGIVRGQCGWCQVIQAERVVGKVRLGTRPESHPSVNGFLPCDLTSFSL